MPAEDKIYEDIKKEASKVIERIMATYNHGKLRMLA
jgi:hypothetical protein